jgi:murein hydrolase activator
MTPGARLFALSVFTLALAATLPALGQPPARNTEMDPKALTTLEASIKKARAAIGSLSKQRKSVNAELQKQEQDIHKIQQQVTTLATQLKAEQATLTQLQKQLVTLEKDRNKQQEWLANYVRSAARNGNQEFFKLVLSQQDPNHNARLLQYYRYFAAARSARMTDYQQVVQSLAETTVKINEHSALLAAQQTGFTAEQANLKQQQQQRQTMLAKLDKDLASADTKLNSLEQERVEMQLLMAELQKARIEQQRAANAKVFAKQKGKLPWPVSGRLAHRFGANHELGDLKYEGITVTATAGTAIKAVNGGRVVFADWFGNSGLLLIIDHGDGFMSLYAHNQELFLKTGAYVDEGTVIAKVGNTGGQAQSALYFEIRHDGKAVDPLTWLAPTK